MTVKDVFVEAFAESTTRRQLFDSYVRFNDQIRALLPEGFTQWIDGSFVSQKQNPGDIDVLTFVDYQRYEQQEQEIDQLKQAHRRHRPVVVDAYFIQVYPESHPLWILYNSNRVEWLHLWSRTYRPPRRNKGFLAITY